MAGMGLLGRADAFVVWGWELVLHWGGGGLLAGSFWGVVALNPKP